MVWTSDPIISRAGVIEKHRAVHLPGEADGFHIGGLETSFLDGRPHGGHGGPPPIVRILLTFERLRVIAGIRFGGVG